MFADDAFETRAQTASRNFHAFALYRIDATPRGESEVLPKQEVFVLSEFLQHKS